VRCPTCKEVMVFGPRGCACTRAVQREVELQELEKMRLKLQFMNLDLIDDEKP